MTIVIAMLLICGCSVLLAGALKKHAEDIIPMVLSLIVLLLLPFYCLDMLAVGKFVTYGVMLAVIVGSVVCLWHQSRSVGGGFLKGMITPGVCVYLALCLFFLVYLKDQQVGLWDELRLWGAVPKALHYTERLQVGDNTEIYGIMQSYPPGMQLLTYFLTSFSADFAENHIFVAYAVLVSAMFLPALKKLAWKQWYLFVPFGFLMAYLPCVFTSSGGDNGWFYDSLFIDPVLGIAVGYVFYLASDDPFSSRFKAVRLSVALALAVMLKDSAIMFAVIAAACAVVIFAAKHKASMNKAFWARVLLAAVCIVYPYLAWKMTLTHSGVVNHLGFHGVWLSKDSIVSLFREIMGTVLLIINPFPNNTLYLSLLGYQLLMCILHYGLNKKYRFTDRTVTVVSLTGMVLSEVAFSVGYLMIFVNGLFSYQRYYSTIVSMFGTYVFLHFASAVIDVKWDVPVGMWKKWSRRVCMAGLSLIVLLMAGYQFRIWKSFKFDGGVYEKAQAHAQCLTETVSADENGPEKVYLLLSEDISLLHHRIYFELIGTGIRVGNFCDDVNITQQSGYSPDAAGIELAAKQWCERLLNENYEYIHLVSVDDITRSAFQALSVPNAPGEGETYRIVSENGTVSLVLVE